MIISFNRTKLLLTTLLIIFILIIGAAVISAQSNNSSVEISGLNITPGSNNSELNFAWFTNAKTSVSIVQIAKASDQSQNAFPENKALIFKGTVSQVTATLFTSTDTSSPTGEFSNKVTVKGLTDSTKYIYRVGDGKNWSPVYPISTHDKNNFGFLIVGDPQLGSKAGNVKTLEFDKSGWVDTLNKATAKYSDASFMISLGDEVNDYNSLKSQIEEYAAYFAPIQLKSLPVATINGNHDFQLGEYYGFHYNFPNLSNKYGISYGNDGDYYFVYGNALFIILNSNTESIATHDMFIRDTVSKYTNIKWRIVAFHHSIYSEAEHTNDPDIIDRRTNYAPVFERYHIDLVLQGHDHSYTRTYFMQKGKPQIEQNVVTDNSVTDPAGILYITCNSGSGSKFYDWKKETPESFSAVRWQGKCPSFGYININGNKLTISAYKTDDMTAIDNFSIVKTK